MSDENKPIELWIGRPEAPTKDDGTPYEFWDTIITDRPDEQREIAPNLHVIEYSAYNTLKSHAEKVEMALETERIRLAGCGVAALQNTNKSKVERIAKDNPYWSASYGDVCNAVDREINAREQAEMLQKECDKLKSLGDK